MQSALEQLNRTPGLLGSIIVADDGLVIARHVVRGVDADAIAATISALARSVNALSDRCGRATVRAMTFESDSRRVFALRLRIGSLVAVAEGDASVGLVRMAMREAVAAIEEHAPSVRYDRAEDTPVHA